MTSKNPNDFWNKIQNLGPRNKHNILMEVQDDEGNVSLNEQTILERWRVDFENLYNGSGSKEFDNDNYNQAISDSITNIKERIMEEQLYQCNNEIYHINEMSLM
jgi:hypothetical protein